VLLLIVIEQVVATIHVTEKASRGFNGRCSLSACAFGDGGGRSSQRWNDNDTGTYAFAAIVLIALLTANRDSRQLMWRRTEMATATATATRETKQPKPLPSPNSDFYELADVLTADEKEIVKKVRAYAETQVQPIINKYWAEDAFPFDLLPSFKELGIGGLGYDGYGCAGGSQKLFGFVAMELARVDASICTFFGVHAGLAMGSIYLERAEAEVAAADGALG
jgi:glutaryl-CoA dehydrogenase